VADIDTSNGKRPPRCELSWGAQQSFTDSGLPFVLESVKQQFVLFLPDGKPVRAKLSVSFKEYIEPTQQAKVEKKTGSFPAQTYTVKAGDTLSAIAGRLWDNPTLWRLLADENTIVNPRLLEPGRVLTVPSIVLRGSRVEVCPRESNTKKGAVAAPGCAANV